VHVTSGAAQWIAAHREQPPRALRERVDIILTDSPAPVGQEVSTELFTAGRQLLASLLSSGSTQRDAALDLLTADALVTYAFESASDDPASLDLRAAEAMRAIAGVVQRR
jgi:hypothetical protein